MNLSDELKYKSRRLATRRHFLRHCTMGLGGIALGSMGCGQTHSSHSQLSSVSKHNTLAHYASRAKRVIYLHMAGSPSQLELFDFKPTLAKLHNQHCPDSLLEGKKFAFISGVPKMLGPQAVFKQHGESGAWISDHLPHFQSVADDVCFLKAMHTDEFNHAPAQLMLYSGSPRLGRPSMGSWVTYGLGSENEDLPGFVVLVSGGLTPSAGKSVWGSGFLPTVYQGVQCRSAGDPVLYLQDPKGMDRNLRKKTIEAINHINQIEYSEVGDPEILTRISQYEMAFKMQISVPEVMDITREPNYVHEQYGVKLGTVFFCQQLPAGTANGRKGCSFYSTISLGVGQSWCGRI